MKTVSIIGATGLVGNEILKRLCQNNEIGKIKIFSRRHVPYTNPKTELYIVDFKKLEDWSNLIQGDFLFLCLGTTLKQVGSRKHQREVDYQYQYDVAKAGKKSGIKKLVLISSSFANPNSIFAYIRMKGDLERDVLALSFDHTVILRPGPLVGKREIPRLGEKISISILKQIPAVSGLEAIRPINAEDVAEVAVRTSLLETKKLNVLNPRDIWDSIKTNSV